MFKKVLCIFIFIVISFTIGCVSKDGITINDLKDYVEIIKPSGMHEDCFEMMPTDELEYFFESSNTLAFNIHYHLDSKIFYAVEKDNLTIDSGKFSPKIKEYYCLMWTNPHKEFVTLKYRYWIKK